MCPDSAFSTQRAIFYSCGLQINLQDSRMISFLLHSLVSAVKSEPLGFSITINKLLHMAQLSQINSPILLYLSYFAYFHCISMQLLF